MSFSYYYNIRTKDLKTRTGIIFAEGMADATKKLILNYGHLDAINLEAATHVDDIIPMSESLIRAMKEEEDW